MLLPDLTKLKRRSLTNRIFWWTVVILIIVAGFSAKPVYQTIKKQRATKIALQAADLMEQKQWDAAFQKVQAALQMNPDDPTANLTMARILTASRQPEAFYFWNIVFKQNGGTTADRIEFINLGLFHKRLDLAEPQIAALLKQTPVSPQALRTAVIFWDMKGDFASTITLARRYLQMQPEDHDIQVLLAQHLFRSANPTSLVEAKAIFWKVVRSHGAGVMPALEALSSLPDLTADEAKELSAELEKVSQLTPAMEVAKLNLKMRSTTSSRDKMIAEAISAAGNSPEKILNLGRWLNQQKAFDDVQRIIPLQTALQSKDLFLVYADAVAGAGKWEELETIFKNPKLPTESILNELFRARIAGELKKDRLANSHWDQVQYEAAQSPDLLAYVASYAERIGQYEQAMKAYRQLAKNPAATRSAFEAMIRLAEKQGKTTDLRDLMKTIANTYPKDAAPQNDLAYLNLLLGENIESSKIVAARLVEENPQMLAYRTTLALAYLRSMDQKEAQRVYDGVSFKWAEALPGWQAIYIAVAGANGNTKAVNDLIGTIPIKRLKSEELKLIKPWIKK